MFDNSSSHLLVGKFFTNSTPPSFQKTVKSLRKQWKIPSGDDMTVQKQDNSDMFLFKFKEKNDKVKVLSKVPYNVDGVIMVIKDPISRDNIIDFTTTPFPVRVVGLPPYLKTKEYIPTLKSLVGTNRSFKIVEDIFYCRVEVDLKKPLRPGFYTEENRFVEFRYSRLGKFCYSCGMIGHVKRSCDQVRSPKERALNATSKTRVYGPWLRVSRLIYNFTEWGFMELNEKQSDVREYEKTLSYAQCFIELEFNEGYDCNPRFLKKTQSTHRFRFPASYLDTKTESSTSKAYEVIEKEMNESSPFSPEEFEEYDINCLVELLKEIKKDKISCDDKWLTLKLEINKKYLLTPVEYETMVAVQEDKNCMELIESKISDLIKKRVENKENLLSLSSWEDQIKEVIIELGLSCYINCAFRLANKAMLVAVQMELSSSNISKIPSMPLDLMCFKVLGDDMDRLDPCTICIEEMFLAEEATVLPCSHAFHRSCIEKWLQVGHKCPLCNCTLVSQK